MVIRTNSMLEGGITEKTSGGGKFMLCFSMCFLFNPSDEDELLVDLETKPQSLITISGMMEYNNMPWRVDSQYQKVF